MEIIYSKSDNSKKKEPSLLWFPIAFCLLIAFAFFVFGHGEDVAAYGIEPRHLSGLKGILLAPFIHGDYNHLFSNLLPLAVLGSIVFTTYKEISVRVFALVYVLTGIWTWMFARDSYHIGASGIVYGLWSFVLISGFLRKKKELIVMSFLIAFLYGSMFWGLFPIQQQISFESHISGMLAGILCAIYYLKEGPQEPKYFEDEPDEPDDPNAPWNQPDEDMEKL